MNQTLISENSEICIENIKAAISIAESGILNNEDMKRNQIQMIKFLVKSAKYLLDTAFTDGKDTEIKDYGFCFSISKKNTTEKKEHDDIAIDVQQK